MMGLMVLAWTVLFGVIMAFLAGASSAATVTLSWNKNTETDLAGYKVYMREEGQVYGAAFSVINDKTAATALVNLPDTTVDRKVSFSLTAFDLTGNESGKSNEISKLIAGIVVVVPKPGAIALTVVATGQHSVRITWPFVDDGTGKAASVNIRFAAGLIAWGSAPSTTCTVSPCDVTGLLTDTDYQFQGVAFRAGTPNVFGVIPAAISVRTLNDTTPPPPPSGLTISKATIDQVIVVAQASECRQVAVDQTASTVDQHQLRLNCVR